MFFRISECLHLEGILCGGRCSTLSSAPRQSKYMCTEPCSVGLVLLMARRSRCSTIRPSNSPRYAFACRLCSGKERTGRPLPFVHSNITAAEHSCGQSSLIYDPSVTPTRVFSSIALTSHSPPTASLELSHIPVLEDSLSSFPISNPNPTPSGRQESILGLLVFALGPPPH
jgi:hypothetical protein